LFSADSSNYSVRCCCGAYNVHILLVFSLFLQR
jgi:hypothetical protein